MSAKIDSQVHLTEMINAYRKSRIIISAHELDFFTTIGTNHLSSHDLAKITGTDQRATDRLMNALVGIGLLEKTNSLYSNTPFALKFLVKTSPDFMGNISHQAQLWKTWSTLTEAVRKGSSVTIKDSFRKRDEDWLKSFLAAMHSRSQQADEVAALLDLSKVRTMLDVGGGSGTFTFSIIRANNNITSTIFDLPRVISFTQEYIEKEGFGESVSTTAGDFIKDEFHGSYDLVLLSAVVHINSPEENQLLINKCCKVLSPGGQLVIMDHIMNEDRTEPAVGAVFAINMLVGTEHGDTYTESEISTWMKNAGLKNIELKSTKQETLVLIGIK